MKVLVHKVDHCRKSIAPPVEMEGKTMQALAEELRGEYDGQYIMIELVGAYKKVYRTMSDLKLKLI